MGECRQRIQGGGKHRNTSNTCHVGFQRPAQWGLKPSMHTGNNPRLALGCMHLPGPSRSGSGEMATHSSVLAWRIPGTGEPRGLPSMGSHRVGHN